MALPDAEGSQTPGAGLKSAGSEKLVQIPTEDGKVVTLHEPKRVVQQGEEEVEIRSLTPEEKARRRMFKNIIMFGFGGMVLLIVLTVLLLMGKN